MDSAGSGSAICLGTMFSCVAILISWPALTFLLAIKFRALEPLLQAPVYPADSRIIWSSSLEASPKFYDKADWQLTKTEHSYESVKYQIGLVAEILDRRALQDPSPPKRIRHFLSEPGICSTKISTNLVAYGGFLDILKLIVFHLVSPVQALLCAPSEQSQGRTLLGSRHHTITPSNAAIAAVHLVLVSISFLTFSTSPPSKQATSETEPPPVRFGAETDRWGNPQVGITPIPEWKENEVQGEILLEKCEDIFRQLSEKRKPVLET